MTMMTKMLMTGAGFAALAAATPATAQYAYPYGNAYGYNNNYGTNMASQRCAAAVQQRLSYRNNRGTGIFGALLGANTYSNARVLGVTRVTPNSNGVRVRGVASSGRVAYNPYGVSAYGMLGSNYAADLSFKCDVDYRGYVRDIDINRR
jgi:hypothetical protein